MNHDARTYKVVTRLVVLDFECDARLVTEVLRVEPTKTWTAGERVHSKAINVHHQNGWMKMSPVDPLKTTPEESISALLSLFPDFAAFRQLPRPSHVQLTSTVYGYTERPYFFLSAQHLTRLGEIGADLDIDIYDLSNSPDEAGEGH